jgi:hypothetical protein
VHILFIMLISLVDSGGSKRRLRAVSSTLAEPKEMRAGCKKILAVCDKNKIP